MENKILDNFFKSGDHLGGVAFFEAIDSKSLINWNTLLTGLALHGMVVECFDALREMGDLNITPDHTTLTAMFTACGHTWAVDIGVDLFYGMKANFGFVPILMHYGMMVDAYGRSGSIIVAFSFVKEQVKDYETNHVILMMLLKACQECGETGVPTCATCGMGHFKHYDLITKTKLIFI
jgi:pentatricopeptide repeat protein